MIATFSPTSAFMSVDLPAFGRPTKHVNPERCSAIGAFLSLNDHGTEPAPAALKAVGTKYQTMGLRGSAGYRHATKSLGQQPSDGVDIIIVDFQLEEFAKLVERHARGHSEPARRERLGLGFCLVVLVGEFANDLLERVLDGHHSRNAAVLVHHDR